MWTRCDPNDRSTWPPDDVAVLAFWEDKHGNTMTIAEREENGWWHSSCGCELGAESDGPVWWMVPSPPANEEMA